MSSDEVKLFVGGLPDGFGEEELRELFSPHGFVRETVILASKSTSGQKCGFVCYQTQTAQEMARAAIAALSDRHCPTGVDKAIQVSVAKNSTAGRMSFPSGGPPQPQPPMGLPGAPYGGLGPYGSLGPPSGQAWLSAMPDGAALPGMPPGMTGGMAGMGAGVGGAAPAWTPSLLPQFVPVNSGPPTVQVNPAGPSDMPVRLFVGTAASVRRQTEP